MSLKRKTSAFIEDVVGGQHLEVAERRAFVDADDVERGRKLRTIRVVVLRERDEARRDGGGRGGVHPGDASSSDKCAGKSADGFGRDGGDGAFVEAEVGDETVLAAVELFAHRATDVIEVKSLDELKELGEKIKGKIVFFNRPMNPEFIETFHAYGSCVDQRSSGAREAGKAWSCWCNCAFYEFES